MARQQARSRGARQKGIAEFLAALLCHLHHNPFIAHPECVTLRADVVGRLKLGLSIDQAYPFSPLSDRRQHGAGTRRLCHGVSLTLRT